MFVKIAIGWLISGIAGIATMSATALSCNGTQVLELSIVNAKTCVRRIVSDLKQIQHEAELVISIATLKGEDGARTPSEVAEAKRQLVASFHTQEQTEFNRYRHVVAKRYKRLQDLQTNSTKKDRR